MIAILRMRDSASKGKITEVYGEGQMNLKRGFGFYGHKAFSMIGAIFLFFN